MQPMPVTETAQGAPPQLMLVQQRVRPEGKVGELAEGGDQLQGLDGGRTREAAGQNSWARAMRSVKGNHSRHLKVDSPLLWLRDSIPALQGRPRQPAAFLPESRGEDTLGHTKPGRGCLEVTDISHSKIWTCVASG